MKRLVSRRAFLGGALAAIAASPGIGWAQTSAVDMVMRRPREDGEDDLLYQFGQPGPYLPRNELLAVAVEGTRFAIQAPAGRRRAPLIVFSHAALVDPPTYRRMFDHLASHGFVVVAPVHDDGLFERGLETRRFDARSAGSWEVEAVMRDFGAWKARVESCSEALDRVNSISNAIGIDIDASRPLLFGHEYGAYTAQLGMGIKVRSERGEMIDFGDPRWYASCLMAPQGPGVLGLEDTSWESLSRPSMILQGDVYEGFMPQPPTVKAQGFLLAPAGNKHLAWIRNGNDRLFFGPVAGTDPVSRRSFEDVLAIVTAFSVAYGNYDAAVFAELSGSWIDRATRGRVVGHYR